MLSIPVHPAVTDADCQTVAEQLNRLATGVASAAL
jgi:dTDP-4-amino-4,6-dideoxygalactose transaminase